MEQITKNEQRVVRNSEAAVLQEEWRIAEGVRLEVCFIDVVEGELNHQLHITQEAGSCLTIVAVSTQGNINRELWIDQVGDDCETIINGVGIGHDTEQLHFTTHVKHNALRGKSKQLYKYILGEEAVGNFFGELVVSPGAQKTEAFQTNRNLLLTPTARINTKPQLEIYADDVKCSHGATTGQLDEQALFYMQQRGIPRQQAKKLMMNAFAAEVLQVVSDDMLKEELEILISK